MNNLTKSASFEKEHVVKLESHSWQNNLTFYGIPEQVNETSAKTESLLSSFPEDDNDKSFNALKGPLRLVPLNGAIKLFSAALQATKQLSLSSLITALPSRF